MKQIRLKKRHINQKMVFRYQLYLTVVWVDKFDPVCFQSKDCQYFKDRLDI